MIDIENAVFTAVKTAVSAAHTGCFTSSEYLRSDCKLPAVTVIEQSNIVPSRAVTSSTLESYATVMYQVDVYSSDKTKKKSECRAILQTVDGVFERLGFRRIFCRPTPNMNNATLYRITARYQGNVTAGGKVGQ